MVSSKTKERFQNEPAQFIEEKIKEFARTSSRNRMPATDNQPIFAEPLVRFADGSDPLFTEYKTIIHHTHLTPAEAMAKALDNIAGDVPSLSIISWILPIASKTRESNRHCTQAPSRLWAHTRQYGEEFNDALRKHVVELLIDMGYLATAPMLEPYFKVTYSDDIYSNWSERHVAYAAGHGTFSLSDGFITERGIAHRCGSVVTNLTLPFSSRKADNPFSNCLFYTGKCKACIARCPAGAITENGHDKAKCKEYLLSTLDYLKKEYGIDIWGCGLCQTKVPCEFKNPVKKLKTD